MTMTITEMTHAELHARINALYDARDAVKGVCMAYADGGMDPMDAEGTRNDMMDAINPLINDVIAELNRRSEVTR